MALTILTLVHVLISLVALAAGVAFWRGLVQGHPQAETLFLSTTAATSLSGYLFPFHQLLPSHIVGAISVVLLGIAWNTRSRHGALFIVTSMSAFYLNALVLFVQTFKRVPPLSSFEGPAQLLLLLGFISTIISIVKKNRTRS